nr:ribonuclease H-like domain-containing protein [Tanacetum cinerariifolium]
MSDLDTMSLDYLYNHLKVYESEVQKKSESNCQIMAFISLAKHNSGNEEVNTASTNVSTVSANIKVASIIEDTACAYIASQSSGSQIKFENINQINEDDIKEMDIKWNMALLSMRADRAPRSQDRGRKDNYIQGSKVEEQTPKDLMAIDEVGWDWSYMANDEENHALVADEEAPTEFALMAKTSAESEDLDSLLEIQRLDKNKEGLRYSVVPPPPAQVYSPPKKDLSWTGLPKFADDTITDYSRPAPTIESSLDDAQNKNPFVTATEASPSTITPKPFIKFVKATDRTFPTCGTKFSTADMGKKGKAVKASACWFWKPSQNLYNKGPNSNIVSVIFKKYTYIDTQGRLNGCSRHMTGNISYLSDYEPFNGGYVSFGQGGCKFTGKRTIKTDKLESENLYFVNDLKYNLFSVSQICDNKNIVLFTDSECIVLGRNFKLSDDANVLLKTHRQHNMYSIDLNNIVPHKDLTCLVAKASADECMLWHRRLGHLNFKTMNKLVRHNLVRGLPTQCFENDHTCTACLKGKQHKAS